MSARPRIPADVKAVLRKEAGFGCCICGFPIYDYHHIVEYSKVETSNPADMMMLCPNHHRQATAGAMSRKEQRYYKRHPFNIQRGHVNGNLRVDQSALVVSMGSNQFVRDGFILQVDSDSLLSLRVGQEGRLELSLRLYDKEDKLLASVDDNEWKSDLQLAWDLQASYNWLKIRQEKHDIRLLIDARRVPVEISGKFWCRGQLLDVNATRLLFNGVAKDFSMKNLCLVGMYLRATTTDRTFSIHPDDRYGKGMMISEADVSRRIEKGLAAWRELSGSVRPVGVT